MGVSKVIRKSTFVLCSLFFFTGINGTFHSFGQRIQISESWVTDCILNNPLSTDFVGDTIKLNKVTENSEYIGIKFCSRSSIVDSLNSCFSGYIEGGEFFYDGPFIWWKRSGRTDYLRYLGNIERNLFQGFVVGLGREENRVTTITYYLRGIPTGINLNFKNGRLSEIYCTDTTSQTGQLKLNFDSNGELGTVSFEQDQYPAEAILNLQNDGFLDFFGSYSGQYVFITFLDNEIFYNYEDNVFSSPWEFADKQQAEYIQGAGLKSKVVPIRSGGWFFASDMNKVTFKLYPTISVEE